MSLSTLFSLRDLLWTVLDFLKSKEIAGINISCQETEHCCREYLLKWNKIRPEKGAGKFRYRWALITELSCLEKLSSLQSLTFGNGFDQPITQGVLPASLQNL